MSNPVTDYILTHEGLVVSEATLRLEDLIPAFTSVLQEMDAEDAKTFVAHYADVYAALDAGDDLPDAADFALEDLFDALDARAPEGYTFGAHEGDGACFLFHKVDVEEDN